MNRGQERLLDLLRFDFQNPSDSSRAPSLPAADEWPAVLKAADRHGLKPYLYHRLRASSSSAAAPAVPDSVLADLRLSYLLNLTVNLRRFQTLAPALRALAAAGVPTIVLKGGYLAEAVYANPALRIMCDVDILVRREGIPAAADALASAGFDAQEHRLYPPPPDANEFHFYHRRTRQLLELHWDLINSEYPFRLDSDAVWAAAVPAKIAGADVLAPAPADLLCHLSVHAAIHSFSPGLKALVDVGESIRRLSPDWPVLAARARRFRCLRPVWLTLTLARRMLAADVPDAVREDLRPPGSLEEMVASARERICLDRGPTAAGSTAASVALALSAADAAAAGTAASSARSARAARTSAAAGAAANPNLVLLFGRKGFRPKIKLALHRAFPSRAALAARYPVSPRSPLIYLCYFRWIRVLIKRNGPAIRARLFSRRGSAARVSAGGDAAALLMDWLIRGD